MADSTLTVNEATLALLDTGKLESIYGLIPNRVKRYPTYANAQSQKKTIQNNGYISNVAMKLVNTPLTLVSVLSLAFTKSFDRASMNADSE